MEQTLVEVGACFIRAAGDNRQLQGHCGEFLAQRGVLAPGRIAEERNGALGVPVAYLIGEGLLGCYRTAQIEARQAEPLLGCEGAMRLVEVCQGAKRHVLRVQLRPDLATDAGVRGAALVSAQQRVGGRLQAVMAKSEGPLGRTRMGRLRDHPDNDLLIGQAVEGRSRVRLAHFASLG
jgi:hypothetical protein